MKKKKKGPGVKVKDSDIGKGVFATQSFRKDDVLGEVKGEIIDDANYSTNYCMDLGDTLSLEPTAPFRFMNHSCEPNCELFVWDLDEDDPKHDETKGRLWVGAMRKIKKGEQLYIDYGWPADSAIPCLCGSKKCRGWVVDPDELHLVAAS